MKFQFKIELKMLVKKNCTFKSFCNRLEQWKN